MTTKIAMVYFSMNQIGGVLQCLIDMKSGFEKIGNYQVDTFEVRYAGDVHKEPRLGVDMIENVKKSQLGVKNNFIWFGNDAVSDDGLAILNKYDIIIFQRGCPSMRSKVGRADKEMTWIDYYEAKPPKYVVMHDPWMEKFYPWQKHVSDRIEAIAPIHYPSWNTTRHWDGRRVWIPFPVNFDPMLNSNYLYERKDLVTYLAVWKPWNYPDIMLRNIPDVDAEVRLYGRGIEYYYISGSKEKRKKKYQNEDGSWLWEEVDGESHHHGVISTEEKWKVFGDSKIVMSLAMNKHWPANTVRVVVEGIGSGAVVLTYGDNIGVDWEGNGSLIPRDAVVLLEDRNKIYPDINDVMNHIGDYQEMVDKGEEKTVDIFSDENVCSTWQDLFEGKTNYAIESEGF